jgi:hypothetical protein
MTIPFGTGKTISINQLLGVDITDVANNDLLQYNSTNAVWDNRANRPYFIKAKLLADYTLTGASGVGTVLTMSAVDFGTGFDYNGTTDWANDEWTCPQTGVYRVSLQLGVQSTTADKTYYAGAILELTGATTSYIYRNESVLFSDDDADQIYLAGTTINKFEQGDELRLIIGWTVSSGTVKARGDAVEDKTFLIIERII